MLFNRSILLIDIPLETLNDREERFQHLGFRLTPRFGTASASTKQRDGSDCCQRRSLHCGRLASNFHPVMLVLHDKIRVNLQDSFVVSEGLSGCCSVASVHCLAVFTSEIGTESHPSIEEGALLSKPTIWAPASSSSLLVF